MPVRFFFSLRLLKLLPLAATLATAEVFEALIRILLEHRQQTEIDSVEIR